MMSQTVFDYDVSIKQHTLYLNIDSCIPIKVEGLIPKLQSK